MGAHHRTTAPSYWKEWAEVLLDTLEQKTCWRDYSSHLAWECLGMEGRDVWVNFLNLLPLQPMIQNIDFLWPLKKLEQFLSNSSLEMNAKMIWWSSSFWPWPILHWYWCIPEWLVTFECVFQPGYCKHHCHIRTHSGHMVQSSVPQLPTRCLGMSLDIWLIQASQYDPSANIKTELEYIQYITNLSTALTFCYIWLLQNLDIFQRGITFCQRFRY